MDLEKAIKTRRTVRKYDSTEPPIDLVMQAIELAQWAPTGGNFQPTRFFVIKDRELISRMADAVQAKSDLIVTWPESSEFAEAVSRYQRNASFFRNAPVLIAVASGDYQSPADQVLRRRGPEDPAAREMLENRAEISSRIQALGGVVAHLLLGLHSRGLGACWMAGPMLARRELEAMLQLPPDLRLFALVPVGYPAENPSAGPRKPLDEVVRIVG